MLSFTIHQGNANKIHNEVSAHSSYNSYYQKIKKIKNPLKLNLPYDPNIPFLTM